MKLKGKKILVTGACGFIGSHLVESLMERGCQVRAFVFYNALNSFGWIDTFPKMTLKRIEVVCGDVRDNYCVSKAVKGMDAVFHLAALIGIPFSYQAVQSYLETNVGGTLNVLQACLDREVRRLVITSTSEVYGTARYVPIDEKHPLQPQSPYSASKIAADSLAESFYRSFDLPVIIARPFNTFGPRQSARAVIPTIITQLLSASKEVRLGSLHPTRDLNYVQDTCEGMIALAECDGALGRSVNIGSGRETSIADLAKMIIKHVNPKAKVVFDDQRKRPALSEVERLVCSNDLIKKLTGWQPRVSLQEGIRESIEWFRNKKNLSKYKWDIYNV